jgi:ribosomal protein S18 acetylase RimI-like enzyme
LPSLIQSRHPGNDLIFLQEKLAVAKPGAPSPVLTSENQPASITKATARADCIKIFCPVFGIISPLPHFLDKKPGLLETDVLCMGNVLRMEDYTIHAIRKDESPLLEDFLYEAIFQRDGNNLLPREIIKQPELSVYIDDFGKPDDLCLVADMGGKIVGAVWTRILSGAIKGFGNIDDETPEFAISLYKEYRGYGLGTDLMRHMITLLKERGYKKTSLAVQKDNYAVKMYESVGFSTMKELSEEYLMICDLT